MGEPLPNCILGTLKAAFHKARPGVTNLLGTVGTLRPFEKVPWSKMAAVVRVALGHKMAAVESMLGWPSKFKQERSKKSKCLSRIVDF